MRRSSVTRASSAALDTPRVIADETRTDCAENITGHHVDKNGLLSLISSLALAGIDTSKVAIRTSGPAANIYINLQQREQGGTVDPATYQALLAQITAAVQNAVDPNPKFNFSLENGKIFTVVETRPAQCEAGPGQCTSKTIGQDYGDVFALMAPGYNFDGVQNPGVARLGDAPFNAATSALSMPNFYGAHGHDPKLPVMSATFVASGPGIRDNATVRHMPQSRRGPDHHANPGRQAARGRWRSAARDFAVSDLAKSGLLGRISWGGQSAACPRSAADQNGMVGTAQVRLCPPLSRVVARSAPQR